MGLKLLPGFNLDLAQVLSDDMECMRSTEFLKANKAFHRHFAFCKSKLNAGSDFNLDLAGVLSNDMECTRENVPLSSLN